MTTSTLEHVEEGDHLFHIPTGEVVLLLSIDAEWQPDEGQYDGTVEMTTADDGDETFTEQADTVDMDLHEGDLQPVSDRLLREPDEVLLEFAQQEIGNYVSRLGNTHDFNGIDGVSIVADLRAAAFLYANSDPLPRFLPDKEYVTFLDWLMVSDPWPLSSEQEDIVEDYLDAEAQSRGYEDWIHAYHEMTEVEDATDG